MGLSYLLQKHFNSVASHEPYPVSDEARERHASYTVVDLHADSLMWNRDLLERGAIGHVDVPRLVEGNVSLQVLTAVTHTPAVPRFQGNSEADSFGLLARAQGWPRATWRSYKERALHHARKLHAFAERSNGALTIVKSRSGLDDFLELRKDNPKLVAGLLGIEGAQALEGRLENLGAMYEAGFRLLGMTHFADNEAGGSAHGKSLGGLTAFGKDVVRRMEELGMVVDLAHASERLIDDVLETATRPTVVSHTGVKGTYDHVRNLSDDKVRAIAERNGIIGIGYWRVAVGAARVENIVAAMLHVRDLTGTCGNIALGSDFDGFIKAAIDTSELAAITHRLLEEGVSPDDAGMIMGGNAVRLLREVLP